MGLHRNSSIMRLKSLGKNRGKMTKSEFGEELHCALIPAQRSNRDFKLIVIGSDDRFVDGRKK